MFNTLPILLIHTHAGIVPFPQEWADDVARDCPFFNPLPTGSYVMCDHFSIVAGHLLFLPWNSDFGEKSCVVPFVTWASWWFLPDLVCSYWLTSTTLVKTEDSVQHQSLTEIKKKKTYLTIHITKEMLFSIMTQLNQIRYGAFHGVML